MYLGTGLAEAGGEGEARRSEEGRMEGKRKSYRATPDVRAEHRRWPWPVGIGNRNGRVGGVLEAELVVGARGFSLDSWFVYLFGVFLGAHGTCVVEVLGVWRGVVEVGRWD